MRQGRNLGISATAEKALECRMTYVVTESCIKCKFMDCVEVCPVDCFYVGENMLVIHPDECIDCGACVPVCPVSAIFALDDVPEKWAHFTQINAAYFGK